MKITTFVILCLTVLSLFSCRKDEINKLDGPSLEEMYGVFGVTETLFISRDSVDFAAGETVYFTAAMTKTSDWKFTITGLSSGAKKIITGTSKTISASDAIWDGSTTEFPIFRAEMCKVELTFEGESDTLTGFVKVLQPKVNTGYLLTDFESGFDPGWGYYIQSGADMDFQIHTDATSPEGGSYYNMAGTVNWDWLIGLIEFKATADGLVTYPLNTNPQNVYFNAMVYGEPGLTNSIILFQFQEDENADGSFNTAVDDQYSVEIPINWVGWKLVSLNYNDIVTATNGNQTHNPDKIKQVNVLLLANPASGYAKSKLDYVIFTENSPLKP